MRGVGSSSLSKSTTTLNLLLKIDIPFKFQLSNFFYLCLLRITEVQDRSKVYGAGSNPVGGTKLGSIEQLVGSPDRLATNDMK